MGQILVRDITDGAKERLRERAKLHGRSLEAEVRAILEEASQMQTAVEPRFGLGSELLALFSDTEMTPVEWEEFDRSLEQSRSEVRKPETDLGE